ncbi:alpha/beta fold hydrolase [Aneurinibacillus sp. REN35]|uniref:alpha/beta fold hydrolase n=1 Tax=Aneurinibacillus sp. REN35 TaxID=3237286 RepID=UPI0035294EF9
MKKTCQANGIKLAYQEQGQGEAVVLLHGFCGSSTYWDSVIPELAKDYRVIAPDLRGHGDSAASVGTYSMELFAEDCKQLLDTLDISQATLFGHSLGGYITLAFAEKYPERLKAFGLIHSTGLPDTDEAKQNRYKGAERIAQEGIEPFVNDLVPKLFSPDNLSSMKDDVEKVRQIGAATEPEGAQNTLKGMAERPNRNAVIANTSLPVLLVAGQDDQVIAPDKTFSVEQQLLTTATLPHVGHMSMYEGPNKLIDTLRSFLQPK